MDVVAGTTFGAWTVIGVEGRAAWVKCRCQTIRLVALEALQTGASQSCGCIEPAGREAASTVIVVRQRHRGRRDRRWQKAPVRKWNQVTDIAARAWPPPQGHADIAPTRFERLANDGYLTLDAPWIVPALLRSVPIQGRVLEPAAGRGHLSFELRRAGLEVASFDLRRYANPRFRHRDGRYPPADDARRIRVGRHESAL
jgi:hypothetical protein